MVILLIHKHIYRDDAIMNLTIMNEGKIRTRNAMIGYLEVDIS